MTSDLFAHSVRGSADGTDYRLVVTEDPHGGLLVVWPDAQWAAWASDHKGGEVRPFPQPKGRALSAVDVRNIGALLDRCVRGAR